MRIETRIKKLETTLAQTSVGEWSEEDVLEADDLVAAIVDRNVEATLTPGQRRFVGHAVDLILADIAAGPRGLPNASYTPA